MPNTGERREIKRYTAAKEEEIVQESKKLVSKVKQKSAKPADTELTREQKRKARPSKLPLTDEQASNRMVDEGDPNAKPVTRKG